MKTDWRVAGGGSGGRTPPPTPLPTPPPIPPPTPPPVTPPPVTPPPVAPPIPPPSPGPGPSLSPGPSPISTPPPTPMPPPLYIIPPRGTPTATKPFITVAKNIIATPAVGTLGDVAVFVPLTISILALLGAMFGGFSLINYFIYLLTILAQILGIKRAPKPWGTVYNSRTKRPIPFARVEILNAESRKLQSVITDADGRYGFLVSEPTALNSMVQIQAFRTEYDFPSQQEPLLTERELYPHIYKGGLVPIENGLANFDLPMDPRNTKANSDFYFGIVSVKLNFILTHVADILFVIGAVLAITNVIISPSRTTVAILALIIATYILRTSGFKLKPFGLTTDKDTKGAIPFGFVALHDGSGARVNFTVSDDKGRYFLLSKKGSYVIKAYTPAHIIPARTKEIPLFTGKGWISKEIGL